jgi:tetratricopeptide (TPR) repeat protein
MLVRHGAAMLLLSICATPDAFGQLAAVRPSGLDGIALIQSRSPDPLQYLDLKTQAQSLSTEGRFSEAEPLVQRLVRDYPVDGQNWLLAGRVARKLGKFDEAAIAYGKAISLLGPGVPGMAEYWQAVSQAAAGQIPAALDTLAHLVGEDHYGHRPSLYSDDAFKGLLSAPRFSEIAGKQASQAWTRDEGWTRDLDYLVAEVTRVNPDYHDRPLPEVFERQYKQLREAIPGLGDEQVYVGMSRMLASLNQGHTNLWPFLPAARMVFKVIPLQFYVFPEGIFVVGADPGNEDLVGDRLVAIEDTPALEALGKIRDIHAADSGMEVLWLGPALLGLAQELKGLGIVPSTDRIKVTLRKPSGATIRRVLTTTTSQKNSKLHAAPGHAAAPAFSNVEKAHWFAARPEAQALYVQVNQIADDRDETLEAFGLRLRSAIKDDRIRNVILDLRHNNGGNTFYYVELLRTLVAFSQQDGRTVYVIIGRGVYSAAANLVMDLERLAAPVFVGEPTSMTGNNYGDESEVQLPYSGIWAGVTSVKWQLGYPYDQRRSIVPNIPVVLTAADFFAGRDPAWESIAALCRRSRTDRNPSH